MKTKLPILACGLSLLEAGNSASRAAGCHIYTDTGDIVYANENFLALYAVTGGEKMIRLPRKAKVVDVLDNHTVSAGASSFSLKMEANTARILRLAN